MEAGMGVQCVLEYLFPTVIGDLLNKMSPALIINLKKRKKK